METSELPLFPLRTVLFPDGPLALRIFEARYLDMVSHCLRKESGFGVCLLLEGQETGRSEVRTSEVGTEARICDWHTTPDGLLGIMARGKRRFRLQEIWRQDDGLNVARVTWLPEEVTVSLAAEFEPLARLLRRLISEMGSPYTELAENFEDSTWVGSRLAEILPINLTQRQYLMELSDPVARLHILQPLIEALRDE